MILYTKRLSAKETHDDVVSNQIQNDEISVIAGRAKFEAQTISRIVRIACRWLGYLNQIATTDQSTRQAASKGRR